MLKGFNAPLAALPGSAVLAGEDADASCSHLNVVRGAEPGVISGDVGSKADGAVGGNTEQHFVFLNLCGESTPVRDNLCHIHLPAGGNDGLGIPLVDSGFADGVQLFRGECGRVFAFSSCNIGAEAGFCLFFGVVFIGAVVDLDESGIRLHGAGAAELLCGKGSRIHGALQGRSEDTGGSESELDEVLADTASAFLLYQGEICTGSDSGGSFAFAEGVAVACDDECFHGCFYGEVSKNESLSEVLLDAEVVHDVLAAVRGVLAHVEAQQVAEAFGVFQCHGFQSDVLVDEALKLLR